MNRNIRVLFIVPYSSDGPSNRLRIEQYFPYLKSNGVDFAIRPFISARFYKILYKKRLYFLKTCYFMISAINRILDLFRAARYDLVFIHREAFPIGPPVFEYFIAKFIRRRIIFDFDDAIFLPNISRPNRFIERFKVPQKVSKILRLSNIVVAGNEYLKDFAKRFNSCVEIIPTPIDTQSYKPDSGNKKQTKDIIIGWIGTPTTVVFLYQLEKVFLVLSSEYNHIKFKIIGGDFKSSALINVINIPWSLAGEIEELKTFDIGIMPMPDNAWTRGKCAFKALLYMSMGIPVVCSPVGVNKEIIRDSFNGFLAGSNNEWVSKLSLLIEQPELRKKIGMEGRDVVEKEYSVGVNAPKFLGIIKKACNER